MGLIFIFSSWIYFIFTFNNFKKYFPKTINNKYLLNTWLEQEKRRYLLINKE